jgi:tetratricopeptide (TPR) repeat protein
MTDLKVTEWSLEGVLDHMARTHNVMKDRQFAFVLGAGASFTSGIPTGQDLAQQWLKDLHLRECWDGRSLEQWIPDCGVGNGGITWETAAEHYPLIFERRFDGDREAGYAELEAAMESKSPSLGYSLLAEIIQNTRHKVVVTTNFDNLVADALAMHAHQSPLVVAHESLTGFVRPQMRRPLVAKIHRDLYLHPLNDPMGVSTMEHGWKIALKRLFQYFTPVVVGYGGNDGSLMDMLMGLDQGDIAGRMIWCYREGSPPPEKALKVLDKHRGLLVKISGFDQFMLQLADKLLPGFDLGAIAERIAKQGSDRADRYRDQASKFSVQAVRGSLAEQRAGEVLSQSLRSGQSWSAWQIRANAEPEEEKRNEIYLEGIKLFPNSPQLAGNYANFLQDCGKYDAAEAMYKTALELNPSNIIQTNNYAIFLARQRKDYDAAELLYKKSLEIDPNDSRAASNYAYFLSEQRKDYNAADEMYKKALELDPSNPVTNGNYAFFLETRQHNFDAAETFYKTAIELNPNKLRATSNYANFLADTREDYDAAEIFYRKALELDPDDYLTIGNFANFLEDQRGDFDAAEAMYKKTLEVNPNDANTTANYASFLESRKGDSDAAQAMYLRAIQLDPNNEQNNANYANFLDARRDTQ